MGRLNSPSRNFCISLLCCFCFVSLHGSVQQSGARRRDDPMWIVKWLLGGLNILGIWISIVILVPLWVAICGGLPYLIGTGLNRLLLKGRGPSTVNMILRGTAYLALAILSFFLEIWLVIMLFSSSAAEWWYERLFIVGAVSNTIGIVCWWLSGLLGKKEEGLFGEE